MDRYSRRVIVVDPLTHACIYSNSRLSTRPSTSWKSYRRRWLLFLVFTSIAPGCGQGGVPKNIPIRGLVSYQGKPLNGGDVLYAPVDEKQGRPAYGKIQGDGTFTVRTTEQISGVIPGKYRISIRAAEPVAGQPTASGKTARSKTATKSRGEQKQKPLIPERYSDPQRSGLTDEVTASHSRYVKLELTE